MTDIVELWARARNDYAEGTTAGIPWDHIGREVQLSWLVEALNKATNAVATQKPEERIEVDYVPGAMRKNGATSAYWTRDDLDLWRNMLRNGSHPKDGLTEEAFLSALDAMERIWDRLEKLLKSYKEKELARLNAANYGLAAFGATEVTGLFHPSGDFNPDGSCSGCLAEINSKHEDYCPVWARQRQGAPEGAVAVGPWTPSGRTDPNDPNVNRVDIFVDPETPNPRSVPLQFASPRDIELVNARIDALQGEVAWHLTVIEAYATGKDSNKALAEGRPGYFKQIFSSADTRAKRKVEGTE